MRSLARWGSLPLLAAPLSSWALGLGDIVTHSRLNQPLDAEIPLTATPEEARLVSLINAYRAAPQGCPGTRAAAPLAADNRLAAVRLTGRDRLQGDLRAAGYQASAVQVIMLAGAPTAQAAMAGLRQQYCRPLASSDYAQIGVSQQGPRWQLVLARPVVSAGLGDWQSAGKAVLAEVNRARAQARTCGTRRFAATTPLRWNPALANAALAHSQDMAGRNYFSHTAPGGGTVDSCADPAVQRGQGDEAGTWFLYCTTDPLNDSETAGGDPVFHPVPMLRSDDLTSWEYVGDALPRKPSWASPAAFTSARLSASVKRAR